MPSFIIPNSWGSRLREENDCHAPAGSPAGGQFCSRDGGTTTADPAARAKDRAEYKKLRARWAQVNNELLKYVDHPDSPEANAAMEELRAICKQVHRLDADPGTAGAVLGLPGGPRDLVIVGAGPGGMSAAMMGGTDGLDTLMVDANEKPGGQAKFSSRIENYPGFPVGASGQKLAGNMYEQVTRVGAEAKLGTRVTGLTYDPATGLKTLTLSDGTTVQARAVVLATGVEFRKLDFPGSDSKNIIYADGDALTRKGAGKPVVVVGGSNGASQAALGAARTAEHVTVLARSAITKGMSDYQVQQLRNHPKISIIEGDEVAAVQGETLITKKGVRLPAAQIGMFLGSSPNMKWLPPEITLSKGKVVVQTDETKGIPLQTGIPGVFAVGDARHGSIGRIGAAVGDGQMAERGAFEYFQQLGLRVAD